LGTLKKRKRGKERKTEGAVPDRVRDRPGEKGNLCVVGFFSVKSSDESENPKKNNETLPNIKEEMAPREENASKGKERSCPSQKVKAGCLKKGVLTGSRKKKRQWKRDEQTTPLSRWGESAKTHKDKTVKQQRGHGLPKKREKQVLIRGEVPNAGDKRKHWQRRERRDEEHNTRKEQAPAGGHPWKG